MKVGDSVKFAMPVEGVDVGKIVSINGAYIYIDVKLEQQDITIERYPNEIEAIK